MSAHADVLEPKTRFPKADVDLKGSDSFKVRIQNIRKDMLLDQGNDVQVDAGQGCISAPGGPRC